MTARSTTRSTTATATPARLLAIALLLVANLPTPASALRQPMRPPAAPRSPQLPLRARTAVVRPAGPPGSVDTEQAAGSPAVALDTPLVVPPPAGAAMITMDAGEDAPAGAESGFLAEMDPTLRSNCARFAVLLLTVLWATNFPVIKSIFDTGLAPPDYAAIRFSLAAIALLPLARWDNRQLLIGSAQCGAWVAGGYVTQAIALTTASANKGAFICASQVIHSSLKAHTRARGFGMGYVRLEALMEEHPRDARTVSALKVAIVGLTALCWSAGRALTAPGGSHLLEALTSSDLPWPALLYTGLVTTAGAILVESYAFKYVPATDAAVILATEPLWASLCSAYLIGETLSSTDMVGGALVISACVVNELKFGGPSGKHEKGESLTAKGD
ncbi:hypothetical protein T492DRAFT_1052900 [Pavlovales sp. CCMP2436]|nr:hypothetical protein T492DRAFT_1052900 [Pavlovales sp. CCMP2436]